MNQQHLQAAAQELHQELTLAEARVRDVRAALDAVMKLLPAANEQSNGERQRPPLRDSVLRLLPKNGTSLALAELTDRMLELDLIGAANAKTARETVRQVIARLIEEGVVERDDTGYRHSEPGWQSARQAAVAAAQGDVDPDDIPF